MFLRNIMNYINKKPPVCNISPRLINFFCNFSLSFISGLFFTIFFRLLVFFLPVLAFALISFLWFFPIIITADLILILVLILLLVVIKLIILVFRSTTRPRCFYPLFVCESISPHCIHSIRINKPNRIVISVIILRPSH